MNFEQKKMVATIISNKGIETFPLQYQRIIADNPEQLKNQLNQILIDNEINREDFKFVSFELIYEDEGSLYFDGETWYSTLAKVDIEDKMMIFGTLNVSSHILFPYGYCGCEFVNKVRICNVEYASSGVFANCTNLTEVIFSGISFDEISDKMFSNCTSLKEITLPDCITAIQSEAFENCRELGKVVLPNNLVTIENGAFKWCEKLEEIIIPEGCETIKDHAFVCCYNLKKVSLASTLKEIGYGAFTLCDLLSNELKLFAQYLGIPCHPYAFHDCWIGRKMIGKKLVKLY